MSRLRGWYRYVCVPYMSHVYCGIVSAVIIRVSFSPFRLYIVHTNALLSHGSSNEDTMLHFQPGSAAHNPLIFMYIRVSFKNV